MKNMEYADVIKEILNCAVECERCATACLGEKDVQMFTRCIGLNRDCADVCRLTATFLARESDQARDLVQFCIQICKACADECGKHSMEHCIRCADVCKNCAEACKRIASPVYAG